MKYTKGKAGPISRHRMTVVRVEHGRGNGCGMAQGDAIIHLKPGPRGVTFLVQGRHYNRLIERLRPNGEMEVEVRWVGREAVTIVKACHIQPAMAANDAADAARAA